MDNFWKINALILIGVILWMVLQNQNKEIAFLLSVAICCISVAMAVGYIKPVLELVWKLSQVGGLEDSVLHQLLRTVGIGFAAEITGRICTDAGNASAGVVARFSGSVAMLYCGIPMIQALMGMIQELVGVL